MLKKSLSAIVFIAVCAVSTGAIAHIGIDSHDPHGFMTGFMHPLTGMDHLAAMVAVGLWSALAARRADAGLLWGPVGFTYMLLVGAVMGLQGVTASVVEPMIAASLLVTGLLVVSRLQVPGIAAAALVGVFAIFHGLAHGYELAGSADATQTLAGMLVATALLHATGLAMGWALRSANVWVPRIAGAMVAALGVNLLTQLA